MVAKPSLGVYLHALESRFFALLKRPSYAQNFATCWKLVLTLCVGLTHTSLWSKTHS